MDTPEPGNPGVQLAALVGRPAPTPSRWIAWWRDLSPLRRWVSLAFVLAYWAALSRLGALRGDHVFAGLLLLVLSYGGPRFQPAFRLLLPLIITGIVYDGRRFCPEGLRGAIHVVEPYALEKRLFGIPTAMGTLTPSEWWQLHTHPALDLVAGGCYIAFILSFVLLAAHFTFRVSRTGTSSRSAEFVRERSPRIMWALLCLNLLGYATAHAYPTAPPWYVAAHGFGPADPATRADPAGCSRFDRLVGVGVFEAFYGRSVDPFGAIPSLHAAYPLLAVYYAFQFGSARVFSVAVFLLTCFSAVYLDHHYIVDLIVGAAYAVLVAAAIDLFHSRARARARGGGGPPQDS